MEDKKISQEDKAIAAVGYVWVLFLIPLLMKKDSEYCHHHAKQGLVLFIVSFAVMFLGMIPVLGWLIILPLGWLIIIVLAILGIINSLQGKTWEMPFLGKYAKEIKL